MDRLRYGRCWWCGEPDSLFRLEGARLAGSGPLGIPSVLREPVDDFRVCPPCAIVFGTLRIRHDAEVLEAGFGGRAPDPEAGELTEADVDRAVHAMMRREARNVRDAFRRAIEERPDAEGE